MSPNTRPRDLSVPLRGDALALSGIEVKRYRGKPLKPASTTASLADADCLRVKDNTAAGKMQGEKSPNPAECCRTIKEHEPSFDPCPVHFNNERMRTRDYAFFSSLCSIEAAACCSP